MDDGRLTWHWTWAKLARDSARRVGSVIDPVAESCRSAGVNGRRCGSYDNRQIVTKMYIYLDRLVFNRTLLAEC